MASRNLFRKHSPQVTLIVADCQVGLNPVALGFLDGDGNAIPAPGVQFMEFFFGGRIRLSSSPHFLH